MLIVRFSLLPDPVSESLCAACRAWPLDCRELLLRPDADLAASLKATLEQVGAAQQPGATLVGVGLAGTWLLALSAFGALASGLRLLALFPYLGVDAAPYGARRPASNWSDRWLSMARLPVLRRALAHAAVTPSPRGLEGIYLPGRMSWAHAGMAMDRSDFVSLIVPAGAGATVVLNLASPDLLVERARVAFAALNDGLNLAFADPHAGELAQRVLAWAQGAVFGDTGTLSNA